MIGAHWEHHNNWTVLDSIRSRLPSDDRLRPVAGLEKQPKTSPEKAPESKFWDVSRLSQFRGRSTKSALAIIFEKDLTR